MSANINCVIISGHVTRDPELRTTQSGSAVLGFGVAVNDRRKNPSTGEWEDVPNFVDCVVFGNRAEPLSRFLAKGSKVCVKGRLRWSQWERDGQKRSKLEVVVDEVELMRQRSAGQPTQQPAHPAYQPTYSTPPAPPAPQTEVYDEDIPF